MRTGVDGQGSGKWGWRVLFSLVYTEEKGSQMDKLYYTKLANFSACFQFNFSMTKDVDCERNTGFSLYITL